VGVSIGTLAVALTSNTAGLEKGMNRARKSISKVAGGIPGVNKGLNSMGIAASAAMKPLLLITAVVIAVKKVADAFGAAINAASNMEETMNKFNVVFGESRDKALAFSNSFAAGVGRSRVEIASFMAESADLFKPIGFTTEAARGMSEVVTTLAVDLASFNEEADADVFDRLTSALTGSSETVKKYGVNLKESAVQQELLNMGLNPKNASEQAKTLARLNILLNDTTDAQGDAVRSQNSYAAASKRLQARIDDFLAAIGGKFIKFWQNTVEWIDGAIAGTENWLAEWVGIGKTYEEQAAAAKKFQEAQKKAAQDALELAKAEVIAADKKAEAQRLAEEAKQREIDLNEKLKSRAEDLTNSLKTQGDKYREQLTEIQNLLDRGMFGEGEEAQAIAAKLTAKVQAQIQSDIDKVIAQQNQQEKQRLDAWEKAADSAGKSATKSLVRVGSKEMFEQVAKAQFKKDNPLATFQKKSTKIQTDQLRTLKSIEQKIGGGGGGGGGGGASGGGGGNDSIQEVGL
jgi:hypothetical protein